jgi:NAD(P)-dependent dehydrogenase (short-subunit alcohol dehydrogenase family)
MMGRLQGKRAVISGAATGIGAATARRFAAEGARLVLLDINEAEGQNLNAELIARGADSRFIVCDVGDPDAVARAVEQEATDGLDIVFANAGIGTIYVGGTVETIDAERWDRAFAINTRGVYALCRAAIPLMRQAGGGSIVVTSSISAIAGSEQRPTHAYAASKGALTALVRAMAVTYGPDGIRVNAILPGWVRTHLTQDVFASPDSRERAIASVPLRRFAEPDEIAACALFLASDEASFVTGASLVVDGGQSVA